ncbi:MAG: hypothetical protein AAFQ14_04245 [Cyanobacteria bacterium J06621_12]
MIQAVLKSRSILISKYFARHIFTHNSKYNSALIGLTSFWLGITIFLANRQVLAQNVIKIEQNPLAQPLTIKGTSRGKIKTAEIARTRKTATGYCDGYVDSQPNHLLQLESFLEFMRLEVASPIDTTLLVKGAGGVWCNDDSSSANPMIEGQWQQGLYQVWIGSYQANTKNKYQIRMTGK